MPRGPRQFSQSQIYHIMLRGNEKKDIIIDDEDKQKFINILFHNKEEQRFLLYRDIRNRLIKELAKNIGISLRGIAIMTGLNRETVRKSVSKEPSP